MTEQETVYDYESTMVFKPNSRLSVKPVTQTNCIAVTDPGFPIRGCQPPSLGQQNLFFGKIFAENCMKMKEIGPGASVAPT